MTQRHPQIPRVAWYRRWIAQPWLLARRPFLRRRLVRPDQARIEGIDLTISPGVHHPVVFRSGAFLAGVLATVPLEDLLPPGKSVSACRALDVGTGTGVQALILARRGLRVTGADLNRTAVRCAQHNGRTNPLDPLVTWVREDLFEAVRSGSIDLVVSNPPFFRGTPVDAADAAWRSQDYPDRFARSLADVLTPAGVAVIILSTDGAPERMLDALAQHGWGVTVMAQKDFGNEIMTIYRTGRSCG